MSTPSTAAAIHHPLHNFYSHSHNHPKNSYSDYQHSLSEYRTSHNSLRLPYSNFSTTNSSPELQSSTSQFHSKPSASKNASVASSTHHVSPDMPPPQGRTGTNWNEFYKNGVPREVIVIDDDDDVSQAPPSRSKPSPPPQPTPAQHVRPKDITYHVDKRRKVNAHTPNLRTTLPTSTNPSNLVNHHHDDSTSNETSSRGRSTAALHSTAPTSLASNSSGSTVRIQRMDNTQIGQKRKREADKSDETETEHPVAVQHDAWAPYVPPQKPPIKAKDVFVKPIQDKVQYAASKFDDGDGHYIVVAGAEFTERYTIIKLLGQGTFGKVVEAFDKKKGTKCAVKIIRAVPKYRDASRIELRVLSTLCSNDKQNRNRCIHLRDCFDFRNHICIVTDLLSESVFDFLKKNDFVPFPSSHIQSFARQLFTSVAFLHDLNLVHTDLKPENILLVRNSYQTFTYNRSVPSSSKGNNRHAKQRRVLFDPEIRLIDFGSATFDDEYHSSVVSTRHYRAPEIILNLGWSFPCDIWSIGCILVEFFTGEALFQTHDNLEHLAMMEPVCDVKIEKEIIDKVRAGNRGGNRNAAAQYFKPRAAALNYPNEETPRTSRKYVKNMKHLDEIIPATTPFNYKFLDLLRRIFVYDPRKRLTAKQALAHPWFKEIQQDDGTEALRIRARKLIDETDNREWNETTTTSTNNTTTTLNTASKKR